MAVRAVLPGLHHCPFQVDLRPLRTSEDSAQCGTTPVGAHGGVHVHESLHLSAPAWRTAAKAHGETNTTSDTMTAGDIMPASDTMGDE